MRRNVRPFVSSYVMMTAEEWSRLLSHAPALILFARPWCDAPEDVVQEAFLKLIGLSRPPDNVVPWLYRVVRNAALDAGKISRRRQKREAVAARPERWFVQPEVDGLTAEIAVAGLQKLPDDQREIIVARLWGGLSFEQIAELCSCSASTAFRRYSAGIDALREELREPCPNRSKNA